MLNDNWLHKTEMMSVFTVENSGLGFLRKKQW